MTEHIKPKYITFIATYRCNAECSFCCFESNPKKRGALQSKQMIEIFDEANSIWPIEYVVFTGGEALLLGDQLFETIKYLSTKNIPARLISNGYWGHSPSATTKIINFLVDINLRELNISTGSFHKHYIPIEHAIAAL